MNARNRYPTIENVSSPRGAPMGRWSDTLNPPAGPVRLFYVPFVDGCYDRGGAYWGGPADLYCATDGQDWRAFVRARSRQDAAAKVLDEVDGAYPVRWAKAP